MTLIRIIAPVIVVLILDGLSTPRPASALRSPTCKEHNHEKQHSLYLGAEPEPEIDWGHCETDAECAALWGDDGGPEPYPLED